VGREECHSNFTSSTATVLARREHEIMDCDVNLEGVRSGRSKQPTASANSYMHMLLGANC
jgi:hypothetical protein